MIGLAFGLTVYVLQGAPSLDPIVVANAFSQVLVVSAAEVVVCWAVVGAAVEAVLRSRGRAVSIIGAALVASTLLGLRARECSFRCLADFDLPTGRFAAPAASSISEL
jgi:hypothetical protein